MIGKPHILQQINREAVESLLRELGALSKPTLSRMTGLSLVTINKTVDALVTDGVLEHAGMQESGGGRNAQLYRINREHICYLGLLLSHEQIHATLADALGTPFVQDIFPVNKADLMTEIFRVTDQMCCRAGATPIAAVSLAVPGVVSGGVVDTIPTASGLEGLALQDAMTKRYHLPIAVENDLNLAAWGLYQKEYREVTPHMALIYLERSVGCGLVLGGRMFKGSSCFAGELGALGVAGWPEGPNAFENAYLETMACGARGNAGQAHAQAIRLLAQAVRTLICVADPGVIALKGEWLTQADLAEVYELVPIPKRHMPTLQLAGDMAGHCMDGLIELCMQTAAGQSGEMEGMPRWKQT